MKKTYIIAEAGVNHNGDLKVAKQLIDVAKEADANAVKFQMFKADTLVSREAKKAAYQIANSNEKDDTQYKMLKTLETGPEMHKELMSYAKSKEIDFMSSPFDMESIDALNKLGLNVFKVPSGEIINLPYLRKLGALNKKIILSTGMANLGEIEAALQVLIQAGTEKAKITVLHCNTEYPTPMEDVNLKAMLTIQQAFNVKVGYSDHTKGIEVPIAAVALGAEVIEKHFTLDRNMQGPDHKASLEPDELKSMVTAIRNIEKALGSSIKKPSASEIKNKEIVRKSIHLARQIKKGEVINEKDILMKRPGNGISPMFLDVVIGRTTCRDLAEGEKLNWTDVQ